MYKYISSLMLNELLIVKMAFLVMLSLNFNSFPNKLIINSLICVVLFILLITN